MTLYRQVQRELIADIQSGKYPLGMPLPNETDLALRFQVSIGTLRRAVDGLVADKVLLRQQGRGTFVGEMDQERFMYQFFKIEGRDGVREFPQIRLLSFAQGRASGEEAQALQLLGPAKVYRFENLLSLQGRPVVHDRIALDCARFVGLTQAQLAQRPGTLYELYRRKFGVTVLGANERTRAEGVDAVSADLLLMRAGEPVLRVARVAHTFNQCPAEFRISVIDTRAHDFVTVDRSAPAPSS